MKFSEKYLGVVQPGGSGGAAAPPPPPYAHISTHSNIS